MKNKNDRLECVRLFLYILIFRFPRPYAYEQHSSLICICEGVNLSQLAFQTNIMKEQPLYYNLYSVKSHNEITTDSNVLIQNRDSLKISSAL